MSINHNFWRERRTEAGNRTDVVRFRAWRLTRPLGKKPTYSRLSNTVGFFYGWPWTLRTCVTLVGTVDAPRKSSFPIFVLKSTGQLKSKILNLFCNFISTALWAQHVWRRLYGFLSRPELLSLRASEISAVMSSWHVGVRAHSLWQRTSLPLQVFESGQTDSRLYCCSYNRGSLC